jgi:hypothetical protein
VVLRHVIETFLQAAQTTTGIKENPDRYSVYLNTNELVGDSDPDTSNMVLLDSSKNLSLYPLKDMVLYIFLVFLVFSFLNFFVFCLVPFLIYNNVGPVRTAQKYQCIRN